MYFPTENPEMLQGKAKHRMHWTKEMWEKS